MVRPQKNTKKKTMSGFLIVLLNPAAILRKSTTVFLLWINLTERHSANDTCQERNGDSVW